MTSIISQLSDTVYRDRAESIVDQFVSEHGTPVTRSQIHGLRQISIQQPEAIKRFAIHQRERLQKKLEMSGKNSHEKLQSQVAFWKLVEDLCEPKKLEWSPATEAQSQMPAELRDENIPAKVKGMSQEDRGRRNQLVKQQREWLAMWNAEHVPAFFQRFCTNYLYHLGKREQTHPQ